MAEIGYALSSEEFGPRDLTALARRAEEAGFGHALISDHFHPWTSEQGQSPFVWGVIGAIAERTERLRLGTGVTCPLIRTHPAIVAQAAATAACQMPGRFFLGVGTGEQLNEHVTGARWPGPDERVEMLEEAVEVIRLLWREGMHTHRGRHYDVDHARLFTLPDEPPDIVVAAASPIVAGLAGRIGDGLCSTSPIGDLVERFEAEGGAGKPKYGQLTVCVAPTEEEGRRTAHRVWPNAGLQGEISTELSNNEQFEQVCSLVREEDVAAKVTCGPDPEAHLEAIRQFEEAGFTHVYVHQVGLDQDAFFDLYEREILPRAARLAA